MRELKFRAFIKWAKLILEVESIDFKRKRVYCKTELGKPNPCDFYNFDDIELMQYTGLKDKNGVEIYEGDICRCWGGAEFNGYYEYNKIYEVKWQGSGFEMVIDDCGYGWNYSSGFEYIEVIGNIYENPELLKEGI